ncbi:unnamed protein product [Linum trigynum]|uniref:Uncharacterized protein n=1 Tax=Linum trigynum TaxID=586398 RepID=A0AAV2D7A3_9ROSI
MAEAREEENRQASGALPMAAACKPDKDISRWLIDFLVRQPIPVHLLEQVISKLGASVVESDWRLKKMLTLKQLQSGISNGSVSEEMLDSLELVEQLDRESGNPIPETIKAAYCAVALECTARGTYFDTVQSIWRGRIENLEKLGRTELLTDELKKVRDDVEAAVWDPNVFNRVLESAKGENASSLVEAYLEEAMAVNGPSFLEIAARRERELKAKAQCSGENREGFPCEVDDVQDSGAEDAMDTEVAQVPDSGVQPICGAPSADGKVKRRVKRAVPRRHSRKQGRLVAGNPTRKYDTLSTPEVKRVQDALRSSTTELQSVVTDPLPDALHRSRLLIDEAPQNIEISAGNQGVPESHSNKSNPDVPLDKDGAEHVEGPTPSIDESTKELSSRHQNVSKPSLMVRNKTACTYEWDDSIDGSPEETSNADERIVLRSPKKGVVLPLPKDDGGNNLPRRKKKRWSVEEENALREGVNQFGRGRWKVILNSRREVFVERNEVDLKDKWRNMTAHE